MVDQNQLNKFADAKTLKEALELIPIDINAKKHVDKLFKNAVLGGYEDKVSVATFLGIKKSDLKEFVSAVTDEDDKALQKFLNGSRFA